jgi:hypothetical protein
MPARSVRLFILPACITLLVVFVVLPSVFFTNVKAAAQQAAKKTVTGAVAPPPGVRLSKPAQILSASKLHADGSITAGKMVTDAPIQRTTAELMTDQAARPVQEGLIQKPEFEAEKRENRPQAPGAIEAAQWPLPDKNAPISQLGAPQTLGTQFNGATGPTETFAFPPDTMGAVGPTQYVVFLNGRLRTFNKTTGLVDGVINIDPKTFFASVISQPSSFTTDPQVRFDRLSNRWFLVMLDFTLVSGNVTAPNRVLLAVNDAASNGVISGSTVWSFYQFQGDATLFTDYESLGIDASALYIGCNMFTIPALGQDSTKGFVIPKAPALTASPLTVWAFPHLLPDLDSPGPWSPRGVDNYNPNNTGASAEGYFIGNDWFSFSTLTLRRVTNPGSLGPAPTMSANIFITTPLSTLFPETVPHLGNTFGSNGNLDGLDDRLYAAHLRNGRLWTAHTIAVDNTGAANLPTSRNAARWYEIQNVNSPGTPSVRQSGTVFDNTAPNDNTRRNYWVPSIMVSGQGHAALGCSIAGTNERINAFTTGRLAGDTLGTLRDGPGTPAGYTSSSTAYNPSADQGSITGRRWGDYSYTSLDPKDDMTMWTIQEYCNGANTYGVRAVKLIAPPPPPTASLTANPPSVPLNNPSVNVVVTAVPPAGQGFYDPGANPPAPHTPFNHLNASGSGLTVNSITYNSPTQVTLNLSTVGSVSGSKTITITNPDGQTTTVPVFAGPTAAKVETFAVSGFDDGRVLLEWKSTYEVDNLGYNVYREINGQRVKITPQLIAGSALITGERTALTAGRSYAWSDQPNAQASYWLEAIDLKGASTWVGPQSMSRAGARAVVSAETSTLLTKLGMAQGQQMLGLGSTPVRPAAQPMTPTRARVALQSGFENQAAIKLTISEDGFYSVTKKDLLTAGLNPSVNQRKLQLWADGQQVPINLISNNPGKVDGFDNLEFYGVGLNSPFTKDHTYWLVGGAEDGLRFPISKTTPGAATVTSFPFTVERRDRTIYFSGLRNGEAENFFGPVITGVPVNQTLQLPNVAPSLAGSATVEVSMQGVTEVAHQVQVLLNGSPLGSVSFTGQAKGTSNFTVPYSLIHSGDNNVQLVSQGGPDISLVDAIRITYLHTYTADNNQLRFTAGGGQTVRVSGFRGLSLRLFDVTEPGNPREIRGVIGGAPSNSNITAVVPGSGTRYLLAVSELQIKPGIPRANIPSNWQQYAGADLVIVTSREMFASLEALKLRRQGQGLSVAVVDIEDIYDQYSFGNKTPYALRDFLSFAYNAWAVKPRYALLVGDSTYDVNNYLGTGAPDIVPSKLIDTIYMEAASDDWFGDFNEDGVAEVVTGRLPALNAAEAANMVNRIIRYETAPAANRVVLVSDSFDGFSFEGANDSLRPLLPANVQVNAVVRGVVSDAATKAQLLTNINAGPALVNYYGHGAVNSWRGEILTNSDAANFANPNLSMFVMMTCLNGHFNDPVAECLAEGSMKAANGGAGVVWASTGQCNPASEIEINQELYRALYEGNGLGDAIKRAKGATLDRDVRLTWILFGDPSGKFRQ